MDSNMLNKEAALNSFVEVKKIHLDVLLWESKPKRPSEKLSKTFAFVRIFINDSLVHKYGPKEQYLMERIGGEEEQRLSYIDDCKEYLIKVGFIDPRFSAIQHLTLDNDFCEWKNIPFSSNINEVKLKRELV